MFLHWQAMGDGGQPAVYNNWTFTRSGQSLQYLTRWPSTSPKAVPVTGTVMAYTFPDSSAGPRITYRSPIPVNFSEQYTIEFYFYATTVNNQPTTTGLVMGTGAKQIQFIMNNVRTSPLDQSYYNITFSCAGTNINSSNLAGVTRVESGWKHIAFVKSSPNLRTLYVNGVAYAQNYTNIDDNPDTTTDWALTLFQAGAANNTTMFGLHNLMRISNIARYSDNFTPGIYGNDSNTWFFANWQNTLQPASNPPPP